MPSPISDADRAHAEALHARAAALDDPDARLAGYHAALAVDPRRSALHYDIGLVHKYRGEWEASRAFNQRAVELAPNHEAANWNLAIAATALHDWPTARAAWHRLGLPIAPGDAPIDDDFGLTPLRLNPMGDAEVVWGRRICPARVRIDNIPYPSSGYRCGDVVLNDGAPMGYRLLGEHEVPVFNALELFAPSRRATWELELVVADAQALARVGALLDAAGIGNEDWTGNVRSLCKACSEGRPHAEHAPGQDGHWQDQRLLGLAIEAPAGLDDALVRRLGREAEVLRVACVLAPPSAH